jgi:hypothetical protein
MVEGGAVIFILKILKNKKYYLRTTAAAMLSGMAEHGAIIHPCTIVELTDSTQRTSGVQ